MRRLRNEMPLSIFKTLFTGFCDYHMDHEVISDMFESQVENGTDYLPRVKSITVL